MAIRPRSAIALTSMLVIVLAAMLGDGTIEAPPQSASLEIHHIHGLAVDRRDPEVLYVATHTGLVRVRPTGAAEWVGSHRFDLMGFTAHPREADLIYASGHPDLATYRQQGIGNLGLLVSRDGGRTWQPVAFKGEADFHALAYGPRNGGTLYGWSVAGQTGFYRISATSWRGERLSAPGLANVLSLAASPDADGSLLAGTKAGVMASRNNGDTWSPVAAIPVDAPVTASRTMPPTRSRCTRTSRVRIGGSCGVETAVLRGSRRPSRAPLGRLWWRLRSAPARTWRLPRRTRPSFDPETLAGRGSRFWSRVGPPPESVEMATSTRKVKCGRGMLRSLAVSLAIIALGNSPVLGEQVQVTREMLVAVAERAPGPTKGRQDAPITIVEFSDFQCSFCRKFWEETLPKIEAEYINTGKARFIYRHLAVLGPFSERAAEAAECAREQGKFWAYHDRLFEKAGRLAFTDARLMEELRLDPVALGACIASGRHTDRILGESALARRLGASGTPTFLINGKLLIGAHPFETFKRILDATAKEPSVPKRADPATAPRP